MKLALAILVTLASILAFAAQAAAEGKADPREKLDTAIPEAIRLLEAKEYETFLKLFVMPEDFMRITKEMSLKEFAKQFGEGKAADLLTALKSIKDQKPTLDAKGTEAIFKLKNENREDTIRFVKVDKFWYIHN